MGPVGRRRTPPPRADSEGSAAANLQLSERRAGAVRQYFVERGIAPERLPDLSRLALRAMIGGFIAACMTGAVVGIFIG
jgi:hypothetical protein